MEHNHHLRVYMNSSFFRLENTIFCFKYLLNCFKKLVAEKKQLHVNFTLTYFQPIQQSVQVKCSIVLNSLERRVLVQKHCARKYYHFYDKVHLSTNPIS